MKRKLIISILLVIVATIGILIALELKAQRDQLIGDDILVIESEILDESRKLLVHLPKDYYNNTTKSYPILIALDGTSHDQDIVNSNSEIPSEIIIIGIPNTDRNRDLTPEYITQKVNSEELGEADKFLSFLEREVIPIIKTTYRTNNYNMLSGNSRSGLFSLYTLIEKPDLFNAYFCYSPALWRNDNIIAKKLEGFINERNMINSFVYLSIGTEENVKMKNSFKSVIKLLENQNNTNIKFNYTEGATHGTNAYYSIPLALDKWSENHKQNAKN